MNDELYESRKRRSKAIAQAGGFEAALANGELPRQADLSLAEGLVLGLLRQGVRCFVGVFGHGSTDLGDVLAVYESQGACRTFNLRNEVSAAHAASALRWVRGEKAAVFTSIGPGALQAFAGSLVAASDGIGVWHIYGDETSEDEGPNMQQIPKHEQGLYGRLVATMGQSYCLHTPLALSTALRRGLNTVDHPYRAGPFFLLLPMNTQPAKLLGYNLCELPEPVVMSAGPAPDDHLMDQALAALRRAERVVVKIGYGARGCCEELLELLDGVDGVAVHTPIASGIIPASHPRNMSVGGSKGSISGNAAMERADLLLAVGTRFVCQSDSSRTAYPLVEKVITINADPYVANHYGRNIPLLGEARTTLQRLNQRLAEGGRTAKKTQPSKWLLECSEKRAAWQRFKQERFEVVTLFDEVWGEQVMTQPVAIKTATDWARELDIPTFFDAGDVQANGFQVVEDQSEGQTFTETGASYMGFAVSALLATAMASQPFYALALTGDGSFTMNPQILIDGVQHAARGCILLLDNRRMGAISGLQQAQYQRDYATADQVKVDYLAWARSISGVRAIEGGRSPDDLRAALSEAHGSGGLSLIHLPVYYGPDPLAGLGAFGRWNVGNWVEETQRLRHEIGL